jgi:tetratricopeptide (TPR) repeat protein
MNQPQAQPPQTTRLPWHSAVLSHLPSFDIRVTRSVFVAVGVGLLTGPFVFSAQASQAQAQAPAPKKSRSEAARSAAAAKAASQASPTPQAEPPGIQALQLTKAAELKADALAAYSEGLAAEDDSDSERAFQAYQRSLDFDPSHTELAVKIAFELARRGDVPKGINLLKDSAKAAPKDFLPPLCLSQIYGKFLKKADLAEKYALQALNLEPKNIGPYLALVEIYAGNQDPVRTAAILDRAAKSSSGDAQFWVQLAEVNLRLAAQTDSSFSTEEQTKLSGIFQKALTAANADSDTVAKVGDFYVLSKQLGAAIPVYQQALELRKRTRPEDTDSLKDKLARTYLATGKRQEAIRMLEELIKDAPLRYDTYELLGELYSVSEQPERALAVYQQALLVDSTQPGSYLRIADMQLRLKDGAGAAATLTDARKRFPRSAQITFSLAVALSESKQHTLALSMFEEALQESLNTIGDRLGASFYFAYGAAAEQAGDLTKAVAMLKKSIELEPDTAAQAYNYLGYMWVDRGENLEEAGTLIKRALALDPENGAYLDSLGWYFYKLGDYEQAVTYLKQALERLQPLDPVVLEHLGDAYAAQGKSAEALENWKHAQTLDPANKTLKEKVATGEKKVAAGAEN